MKEKFDRDPKDLVEEFKLIVDENCLVKFDDYGTQKEPASQKYQAKQLLDLADQIMNSGASEEDKEEVARRMEAGAKDYLERILNSDR